MKTKTGKFIKIYKLIYYIICVRIWEGSVTNTAATGIVRKSEENYVKLKLENSGIKAEKGVFFGFSRGK